MDCSPIYSRNAKSITSKTLGDREFLDVNPGSISGSFLTQDGSDPLKTSPTTVSNTTIALTVPSGAYELVIVDIDQDLRVSDQSDMTPYFVVRAANPESITIPCGGMTNIYLLRDGGSDSIVQFFFKKAT